MIGCERRRGHARMRPGAEHDGGAEAVRIVCGPTRSRHHVDFAGHHLGALAAGTDFDRDLARHAGGSSARAWSPRVVPTAARARSSREENGRRSRRARARTRDRAHTRSSLEGSGRRMASRLAPPCGAPGRLGPGFSRRVICSPAARALGGPARVAHVASSSENSSFHVELLGSRAHSTARLDVGLLARRRLLGSSTSSVASANPGRRGTKAAPLILGVARWGSEAWTVVRAGGRGMGARTVCL